MIVTVAIGDVLAGTVIQLDLETVTVRSRVIYGVEIVDGTVGNTGPDRSGSRREQGDGCGEREHSTVAEDSDRRFGFHCAGNRKNQADAAFHLARQ